MEQFTVNVPVRDVDAEDVKNAFADAYGYKDTIDLGNGVNYPNPVTKEQFVTQCCTGFLLSIFKGYMVENAEAIAVTTASQEASTRAAENVALFDAARLAALPVDPFTNHPTAADQSLSSNLEDGEITITLTGSDPDNLPLTFEIVDSFVNGTATVDATGNAILVGSADVNAEASVASTGIRVRTGDATITGNVKFRTI